MSESKEYPPAVPFRIVIASIVGLWLCYFLLTTLRAEIIGLVVFDEMLWRRTLVCVSGGVVTFGLWLVLRVADAKPMWVKIAVAVTASAPAAILIAQLNQSAFAEVQREIESEARTNGAPSRNQAGNVLVEVPATPSLGEPGQKGEGDLLPSLVGRTMNDWRQLTDIALVRYSLLLAWSALYFALLAVAQARAAERREGQFRRAAKAAELRSLRYQVNPHFLFNTLNSLSALVMTGKTERAETMIQGISNFYRHSLADDPTSDVALADEFELQRHYLEIEEVRFPNRLRSEFDLPAGLKNMRVPGMILQPLVENSVKYAVAPSSRPILISLSAREEFGRLVVTISDNGSGLRQSAGQGGSGGFGIGLANVRDRLRARYGQDAQIVSGSVEGGYRTELRLPMVDHERD